VLPLHLELSSADAQALALLSASSAPRAVLLASITTRASAPKAPKAPAVLRAALSRVCAARAAQTAAWWPAPASDAGAPGPADEGVRRLCGELHVPRALAPPCATPDFTLSVRASRRAASRTRLFQQQYTVALLPFAAAGFVPAGKSPASAAYEHTALQTQAVDIATAPAPGVRAVAVTPPAYGAPEPWPAALNMKLAEMSGFM
jgi:hypothetical protein